MTLEQAKARLLQMLKASKAEDDIEARHILFDDAVCEFVESVAPDVVAAVVDDPEEGLEELTEMFWYA